MQRQVENAFRPYVTSARHIGTEDIPVVVNAALRPPEEGPQRVLWSCIAIFNGQVCAPLLDHDRLAVDTQFTLCGGFPKCIPGTGQSHRTATAGNGKRDVRTMLRVHVWRADLV